MKARLRALLRFNRDTRLLIATSGIFAISFYGIQMLLRVLYILRLGRGPEYVGLFGAAAALTYMSMGLPSGALGKRFGVRRAMLAGGIVTIIGMALLPLTEYLPTWAQGVWPIVTQMVRTTGWSMFNVNLVPALMATTSGDQGSHADRNSAYAINSMLKGLGTFLGNVAGGILPGLFAHMLSQTLDMPGPYGSALWVGAVLGIVALIPLGRVGEIEQRAAEERTETWGRFPMLPVALMVLHVYLSQGGWATCQAFAGAYMDTVLALPAFAIGLVTGVGQFAATLAPLLNPRLARHRGDGWTLMVTALCTGVSLLPLALIPHWTAAAVGRLGVLALSAMWMPALHVYQMERIETRWRSLAYGAVSMAMGFSFGSASLAGGYIIAAAGYRTLFLLGAGLSTAGAVLMWAILRRQDALRKTSVLCTSE